MFLYRLFWPKCIAMAKMGQFSGGIFLKIQLDLTGWKIYDLAITLLYKHFLKGHPSLLQDSSQKCGKEINGDQVNVDDNCPSFFTKF